MANDEVRGNGEAQALIENQLLNEILDQLEDEAKEEAIAAELTDDEMRRASLGEVRAIRSLRAKLRALAYPEDNRRRGKVA